MRPSSVCSFSATPCIGLLTSWSQESYAVAMPAHMLTKEEEEGRQGKEALLRDFQLYIFGWNYLSRTSLAEKDAGELNIFVFSLWRKERD